MIPIRCWKIGAVAQIYIGLGLGFVVTGSWTSRFRAEISSHLDTSNGDLRHHINITALRSPVALEVSATTDLAVHQRIAFQLYAILRTSPLNLTVATISQRRSATIVRHIMSYKTSQPIIRPQGCLKDRLWKGDKLRHFRLPCESDLSR